MKRKIYCILLVFTILLTSCGSSAAISNTSLMNTSGFIFENLWKNLFHKETGSNNKDIKLDSRNNDTENPAHYYTRDTYSIYAYDGNTHRIDSVSTIIDKIEILDRDVNLLGAAVLRDDKRTIDVLLYNNGWSESEPDKAELFLGEANHYDEYERVKGLSITDYYQVDTEKFDVPSLEPGEVVRVCSLTIYEDMLYDVCHTLCIELPKNLTTEFVCNVGKSEDGLCLTEQYGGMEGDIVDYDNRTCAMTLVDVDDGSQKSSYTFDGSTRDFDDSWLFDVYLAPDKSCEMTYHFTITIDDSEYNSEPITKKIKVPFYNVDYGNNMWQYIYYGTQISGKSDIKEVKKILKENRYKSKYIEEELMDTIRYYDEYGYDE